MTFCRPLKPIQRGARSAADVEQNLSRAERRLCQPHQRSKDLAPLPPELPVVPAVVFPLVKPQLERLMHGAPLAQLLIRRRWPPAKALGNAAKFAADLRQQSCHLNRSVP